MENEIYVVEVCLAPGYWELATDTYFTDMESAEAVMMDIKSIMKTYRKDVPEYRIKPLTNDKTKQHNPRLSAI